MNNYLKGISTLLDIFATQGTKPKKDSIFEDWCALQSDWQHVGSDLWSGIAKELDNVLTRDYADIIKLLQQQSICPFYEYKKKNELKLLLLNPEAMNTKSPELGKERTALEKSILNENPDLNEQDIENIKELINYFSQNLEEIHSLNEQIFSDKYNDQKTKQTDKKRSNRTTRKASYQK